MRIAKTFSWILVCVLAAGCGGDGKEKNVKQEDEHHDHDHDHHGPHGGHIIELADDHSLHAEWLHDDATGKVTVMILDGKMKDLPIAAEKLSIVTQIEGEDPQTTELLAERGAEEKTAYKFAVVDKLLIDRLILAGSGVTATLNAEIEGKPISAEFKADEHDH